MTLARERAMATAYLLGGDEDVREGVAAAQDMGGRVVLITIPGSKRAFTLVAEADEEESIDLGGDAPGRLRKNSPDLLDRGISAPLPCELAARLGRCFLERVSYRSRHRRSCGDRRRGRFRRGKLLGELRLHLRGSRPAEVGSPE